MSGNRILLDSNIVIYLSQNKLSIDEVLEDDKEYAVSIITYMEILSYNFPSTQEENFIRELLTYFEIIDINHKVAEQVIALKKRRRIKLPDAIIVATALMTKSTLYTNDRQLTAIEGLECRVFS